MNRKVFLGFIVEPFFLLFFIREVFIEMIDTFTFQPKGTCSTRMVLKINHDTDVIEDFEVVGGCPGNLSGIRRLIIGMNAKDVAGKLSGTTCRSKPTSCPDQLSKAIKAYYLERGEQL